MGKRVFLLRTKEISDKYYGSVRCAYIDIESLKTKHVGIDGKFNVYGACYSASLGGRYFDYEYSEVETVLTESQYNRLVNPNKNDFFDDIIKALTSSEAEELFNKIIEEEKESVKDNYGLSSDEVDTIFNEYSLPYQDRDIVSHIWRDCEELGREYMEGCYDIPECLENYIDYKSFGEDLVDKCERYVDIGNGYIAECVY